MSGHTYDKWQELGYQVKKGAKADYNHYGQSIFKQHQVVYIGDDDDDGFCDRCGKQLRGDLTKELCYECWSS